MNIIADQFVPLHINASKKDLAGNQGINRYIFLCGSDERAKKMASQFNDLVVKEHPRQHNLYLGTLNHKDKVIDVASISTGVGCPSEDNIINELYLLGGKRFLRIGTSGSLQPKLIKAGSVVIATSAVRDEDTSACYISPSYPAVASIEMINAAHKATELLSLSDVVYSGIVHTKSSFYAREMGQSHLKYNEEYMQSLKNAGVLATEMECSHLFILASLFSHREVQKSGKLSDKILAGGILAVVGDDTPMSSDDKVDIAIERAISIGFETIKVLAEQELP